MREIDSAEPDADDLEGAITEIPSAPPSSQMRQLDAALGQLAKLRACMPASMTAELRHPTRRIDPWAVIHADFLQHDLPAAHDDAPSRRTTTLPPPLTEEEQEQEQENEDAA